jgi:hypothetical protein
MFKKSLYAFSSLVCLSFNDTYAMEKDDPQSDQKNKR